MPYICERSEADSTWAAGDCSVANASAMIDVIVHTLRYTGLHTWRVGKRLASWGVYCFVLGEQVAPLPLLCPVSYRQKMIRKRERGPMRLQLLLAADYANITGDGKLNVMGVFREINASSFPARHPSMHLVIILSAELGEYGQTRDLVVKLLDGDGNELMNLSGPVNIPRFEGGRKPEVNAILGLRDITFPKPGPYQFVVLVDKDYKGDLTIYANQVSAPEAGQAPLS
jgi:hypothetical protein